MKRILVLMALLCAILFSSCLSFRSGNGVLETRTYNVTSFTGLDFSNAAHVIINQSDTYSVSVTLDSNLIDDFTVTSLGITDKILQCKFRSMTNYSDYSLTIIVGIPTLKKLNISGATDVILNGNFIGDSISLDISGASLLKGDLSYNSVTCELSGASEAKISGNANSVFYRLSGASHFAGFNFTTSLAQIDISGASQAEIFVNDKLTGNASGASTIIWKGNGSMNVDVSGASSISRY